jgi:hypothetical protein
MSDTEQNQDSQVQQELPQLDFDPARLACRVLDVHAALQRAFTTFAQNGDTTLEGLAKTIQDTLGEIPAFLIGEDPGQPA